MISSLCSHRFLAVFLCLWLYVLHVLPITSAFSVTTKSTKARSLSHFLLSSSKGFGDPEERVPKKVATPGAQKRAEGSQKYDEIASKGGQEYRIFVRQFGSNDQSWLPCGLIAVPRGAQVADAIYSNVSELQAAIVRTYPKLKGMEGEFEYGFNLKIYPDDPIEVAKRSGPKDTGFFSVGNWVRTLLSPVDTSRVPPPPSPQ
jgi:Family of unknown function (DUF6523)